MTDGSVHLPFFGQGMLLLAVAGIIVPFFQRMRLSPVLAYLLAGFILGPHGLVLLAPEHMGSHLAVLIPTTEEVRILAELGIVFLLFMIGLDISPAHLWSLRRFVLGLGGLQFALTAGVITAAASAFGHGGASSVLIGCALALSSTAIVMQILSERHETASPLGRASFSILLMQDLAAVPVLVMAGVLTGEGTGPFVATLLVAFAKAVLAVVVILITGRVILRPLFRLASRAIGPEAFLAVALMVTLGTAALTGSAGLSMALGAFLAGMMLAETEFSPQIQTYLAPFKGLLLGVFFMSVGMGFDVREVMGNFGVLFVSLIGMIALKSSLIAFLCRWFGMRRGLSLEVGLLLSQSGEFAFIILGVALGTGLLSPGVAQFMMVLTGLSMAITPALATLARRLEQKLDSRPDPADRTAPPGPLELEGHVIIAGYGRVGRVMAEVMEAAHVPWLALDTDPQTVGIARGRNLPVWYGDARQIPLLETVKAERAQAIVVTVSATRINEEIIRAAHQRFPLLPLFARATDRSHARHLRHIAPVEVMPENLELALQLSAQVLRRLKVDEATIHQRLLLLREAALRE